MKKQDLISLGRLPDKPGIYIFRIGPKILYIGKATSLKDRVRSYFLKDLIETRGPLILDMVFKAKGLKWQETDSVLEALILEANLIKKYQPHYNTKEKDQKSFNYVGITREPYPRVVIVRGKDLNSKLSSRSDLGLKRGPTFSRVFGPYTSGSALKEALKIIRRIFPFFDDKSRVKGRYEFYRQLGLAPQADDRKAYGKNIKNIKLFFEGKKSRVIKNLEKEMKALAKEHKFERAGLTRNQIFSLKHIRDVALIKEDSAAKQFSWSSGRVASEGSQANQTKLAQPDTRALFGVSAFRIDAYEIAHMGG